MVVLIHYWTHLLDHSLTAQAFSVTVGHDVLPHALQKDRRRSRKTAMVLLHARYSDEEDGDDDDDDVEPPTVDVSQFTPPSMSSFGYNKGRSSPSQRKAMGKSSTGTTKIHLCSNCGSEFVKWMGRCPTCKEWNTIQEHFVVRNEPSPFDRPTMPTRQRESSPISFSG